ncbi:MAG: hypothetical protein ACR2JX_09070 [Mycobacteriales bacterium]
MSSESPTPSRAADDLARAADVATQLRSRSRWMASYLTLFGVGFAAITVALGLLESTPVRVIVVALWVPFVVGMVIWSSRQRVVALKARRRAMPYWAAASLLYAVVLVIGTPDLLGNLAYWLPAAAVVALPLLIGAWRERRA